MPSATTNTQLSSHGNFPAGTQPPVHTEASAPSAQRGPRRPAAAPGTAALGAPLRAAVGAAPPSAAPLALARSVPGARPWPRGPCSPGVASSPAERAPRAPSLLRAAAPLCCREVTGNTPEASVARDPWSRPGHRAGLRGSAAQIAAQGLGAAPRDLSLAPASFPRPSRCPSRPSTHWARLPPHVGHGAPHDTQGTTWSQEATAASSALNEGLPEQAQGRRTPVSGTHNTHVASRQQDLLPQRSQQLVSVN